MERKSREKTITSVLPARRLSATTINPPPLQLSAILCVIRGEHKSKTWRCDLLPAPADNLSKAGWCWGCVSAVDSRGRALFVADAHREENQRFVVRADEKLTAFVELESAIRAPEKILEGWRGS